MYTYIYVRVHKLVVFFYDLTGVQTYTYTNAYALLCIYLLYACVYVTAIVTTHVCGVLACV